MITNFYEPYINFEKVANFVHKIRKMFTVTRRTAILILTCLLVMIQCVIYFQSLTKEELPGDNIHDFVPPFIPILNDYAVDSRYKLLGCNIRKSMSQLSFNIMCYLNNTEKYEKEQLSLSDTWENNRESCANISWNFNNKFFDTGELKMNELTKFAFIRHPEERFASFFLDKCMRTEACGNCTEPRCAIKMVYHSLMQVTRNQSNIIKDDESMWTEWHIAPQTWNCDFHKHLNDYHLIPIGTSLEARIEAMRRLSRVLQFAGIPRRHIEKIISETEKGNTKHSTYGSKRSEELLHQIRNDPYIQHYLHRTYYHDYVAFGFNISGMVEFPQYPKIVK